MRSGIIKRFINVSFLAVAILLWVSNQSLNQKASIDCEEKYEEFVMDFFTSEKMSLQ